jgi:hypothetical protein
MKAYKLGRRTAAFARYTLLLFDDRVEEVSYTLAGLEVKRFFFDEADFMTVHRPSNAAEVSLAGLVAAIMGTLALLSTAEIILASILGSLAALLLALAVFLFFYPSYKLVLAAPSPETIECLLPRRRGRREDVLARLTRAIARYQSRSARAASPAADAAPSPAPPTA